MRKVGQFLVAMLLIAVTLVAMSIVPGQANPQPQAEVDTFIWPWFFPHDPEIFKCWSSLLSIEGCKNEIIMAFITLQINLGPACCKAINELSENCVPKIFSCIPFNPFLPPLIKDYCASIGGIPSPPTPVVQGAPPPPTAEDVSPPPPPRSPPTAEDVPPPPPRSPPTAEAVPPSSPAEQIAPTPTADLAPNAPDQGELSPPSSDQGISPSFDQVALNTADDGIPPLI